MCGIAGIVGQGESIEAALVVKKMTDALAHRGPDGEGILNLGTCVLGHRRLSIIDIEGGVQPMRGADSAHAVTFNGEIYGFQEIKRQLVDYPFRTRSDTEVILALYRRYGLDMLRHLPGMFAFALWDGEARRLICARDRFGEKPLYYARTPSGALLFASEIKGILASGLVEPIVDRRAIARFLQRQCVAPDQSIYENIKSLPPGSMLRFERGNVSVEPYWISPDVRRDMELDEAIPELQRLLRQAVARQLVADVPVGLFLSGGLDSSTICQVASEISPNLRTFAFDFGGEHSEVHFARMAAESFKTRHSELAVPTVDIADSLLLMRQIYDEPFGDTSAVPSFLLAQQARKHVKVALTGDAGDELFGGYLWYQPLIWMERFGRVGALRWLFARIGNRLMHLIRPYEAQRSEYRIMGMGYGRQYADVLEAHKAQLKFFPDEDVESLGLATAAPKPLDTRAQSLASMDDAIRFDVLDYMPSNNLTRTDRAAMANGLELRAPFLDVDLATFCMSVPFRLKVDAEADKIVLRRAFSEKWPVGIRSRKKQGFGAPVTQWLQDQSIRELVEDNVRNKNATAFGILPFDRTLELYNRGNDMQRWTLLVLMLWMNDPARRVRAN